MVDVKVKDLVEYIARGHSFEKHVLGHDHTAAMQGLNSFRATETNAYYDRKNDQFASPKSLGGGDLLIETPNDLAHYIENEFLRSPHTVGYVSHEKNSVNLCNTKDNVAMHFTWNNGDRDFGTIYRYPKTLDKFETYRDFLKDKAEFEGGRPVTEFDNASNIDAAVMAIETMLKDINAAPQSYLFDGRDLESTVQNKIFGSLSRPGRTWQDDEVVNAPHNVKGHSKAYAEHYGMDIPAEELVCIKQASEEELNVGRVRKSLRSSRVVTEVASTLSRMLNLELENKPVLA